MLILKQFRCAKYKIMTVETSDSWNAFQKHHLMPNTLISREYIWFIYCEKTARLQNWLFSKAVGSKHTAGHKPQEKEVQAGYSDNKRVLSVYEITLS